MKYKRLLSWLLSFAMIAGMLVVPAAAEEITTITQDNPSGTMTITLEVPKKTPAATDLTYTAPSDLVYSGSAKTATVAPASGVTGMGEITVKYYSDAARTAEAEPVNVGAYYVGATVAEGDQYTAGTAVLYGAGWEFTVTPSTPAAPAAPTVASATKTGITLNAVSGCEYSMDGTNWQDGTEFTGLNPGTEYTFYQRIKATANTNASAASAGAAFSTEADTYAMTITLVINRAQTITAENVTATYGDTDKSVSATTDGDGAISYAVKEGSDVIDVDASTGALTIKKVGTATVVVTAAETANYQQGTKEVTVTIGKKAATVTAADKSKTYGADDPELTATVEGTVGNDTINYTLSRAEGENVGEYAITVTPGENPNYDVTVTNAKLTIGKKAATVTANNLSKVYGESDPELTAAVEGTVGTDTINYTLSRAEGENVGEYAITVTLGENPNYDVTATNAKFTIGKKAATVTAANLNKVYGESDPELTATVEGTVGTDAINYTLSRAEGENAGEYAITVTLGENPNYDVTALNGVFTILKKAADVTVTANNLSKVYGEDDPELTATVTGLVGSDTLNYTLARAEGENVGEYAITVTLGENPNYDVAALNGVFTITKKAATVTADDLSKVYGESDPELTATVEGVVGEDTLAYTLSRAEGENVGEYEINVALGENPNYEITATNGKLTITKADPSYTAPEGLVAVVGWTLADVALPEGWTWNDPAQVIEEAGAQTFPATFTPEDTDNYNTAENIDLTVTAKAMKFVDVPDGSYYYDAVYWAVAHDITAGTDETHFSPNVGATRAQVVTFLWRAAGSPEPTATESKFTDVKEGSYYEKAVLWATEAGVTSGTSATTFSPDKVCTRAEIVTFLWHANGSVEPTSTECKFTDVKAGAYYEKAVLWAAESGITAGTSATTFSPNRTCTRAQIVTFLFNADKLAE